jgi:uncharacterized Zn finger protein
MPESSLDCVNIDRVRSLAGDRWFARGQAYVQQGRVTNLRVSRHNISASVSGTETYRVKISCNNSRISYDCSCPVGADGNFCKHCVAVSLAWLENDASDLRAFLEQQDRDSLIELILDEASNNRTLRERLESEASRSGSNRGKRVLSFPGPARGDS